MSNYFRTQEYKKIQTTMAIYHQTTGIPCILINEEGKTLHVEGQRRAYCHRLETLADGGMMCQVAHHQSSLQSNTLGEAYISYCPAGLIYFTVAISSGSLFKGALIAGPVHMSEPDDYEVFQAVNRYHIPESETEDLVRRYMAIPIISPVDARHHLQLMTILAKDIMSENRSEMEKKKAFFDEQRVISESIQSLKGEQGDWPLQHQEYPIHLEKRLSSAIIKGDEAGAKKILNDILGFIFYKYRGDNRRIKAIALELVVVISRAAVDGGARYEDVTKVSQEITMNSFQTDDIEALCLWLMDALERVILFVFPMDVAHQDQLGILRKAVIYMNQHLQQDLSLEEVAEHVNLSPTYFSRLFSHDMKMTYIEYLTKIRVEESKKYLVDREQSISDIAMRLGFSDQSYFSKVFKKVEGITPGKYRKMYM